METDVVLYSNVQKSTAQPLAHYSTSDWVILLSALGASAQNAISAALMSAVLMTLLRQCCSGALPLHNHTPVTTQGF